MAAGDGPTLHGPACTCARRCQALRVSPPFSRQHEKPRHRAAPRDCAVQCPAVASPHPHRTLHCSGPATLQRAFYRYTHMRPPHICQMPGISNIRTSIHAARGATRPEPPPRRRSTRLPTAAALRSHFIFVYYGRTPIPSQTDANTWASGLITHMHVAHAYVMAARWPRLWQRRLR